MPTILGFQQWKMIKHFEGEVVTGHPVRNLVAPYPTKQKSQVVVKFKHGDPEVEEAPPKPSKNIRIININIQIAAHQKKSSEENNKKGEKHMQKTHNKGSILQQTSSRHHYHR